MTSFKTNKQRKLYFSMKLWNTFFAKEPEIILVTVHIFNHQMAFQFVFIKQT